MFRLLGKGVTRFWWLILAGWVAAAVLIKLAAPSWDDVTHDGDLAYLPATMTSVRAERLLAQAFPEGKAKSQMVLIVSRADGRLTRADLAVADHLAQLFQSPATADLPVQRVLTHHDKLLGRRLVSQVSSERGQAVLVILELANEFMATDNVRVLARVEQCLAELPRSIAVPPGLALGVTGSAAIGGDALTAAKESIANIEISTIVLVVAILLVVYRAPLLVLVPVLTMVISASVAMDLVAAATQMSWLEFKIFKTTKIFVIVILFGGGTDYCLFLIARFREELARGFDQAQATAVALSRVADALLGSAITTVAGLGLMFFADFGKFRYSGPVIAVCLTVTLVACLTFSPALLRALGPWVFWPGRVVEPGNEPRRRREVTLASRWDRFWARVAEGVLHRPGWVLLVTVAVLLPWAVMGWEVPISYDLLRDLDERRPSIVGTRLLQRHFAPGDIGPLTIVAHQDQGGLDTRQGEIRLARLTRELYEIPGVYSVRSLTEPLGDRPYVNPLNLKKAAARRHQRARETYLSTAPDWRGKVARFEVVFDRDPFAAESVALLGDIDDRLAGMARDPNSEWYGAEFLYAGTTAGNRDLRTVTESDQARIQWLVTAGVFLVLLILLRRPVVCLYLILTVLFSYFVTIGATEWAASWWFGEQFHGLDWKVPLFLFVILVAVGEDYNIYLATRVFEEQARYGPQEGLRRAVHHTGGIITSCGVIMAGSFVSMMTGTLRGIVALGFALTVGILLDTFVIRTVLVPAFLALWYGAVPEVPGPESAEPATTSHELAAAGAES